MTRVGLIHLLAVLAWAASAVTASARPPHLKCTTLIAGKNATRDGAVILAHNEDLGHYPAQHYISVPRRTHRLGEMVTFWSGARTPQVPVTYAYSATTIFDFGYYPGDITSGINEHQVSVANNLAFERDAVEPFPEAGRLLWTEFTRTALERATTARQAVAIIGWLAERFKLGGSPGTLFGITDPEEGWWIEVTPEGQWVAQRVPDDAVEVRANAWRIGVVDVADSRNVLFSAGLVENAKARGFYTERDGPFDFARVYGDPDVADAPWNTHREQRVHSLLQGAVPGITPFLVMEILRDHHEGTPLDLTDGYTLGSPHDTDEYTLCNMTTEVSVVCLSRGFLPAMVGAVCWRSMTTPCSSVFVPWYLGHTDIPREYQTGTGQLRTNSAYWAFRLLSEHVNHAYAQRIHRVQAVWQAYERHEQCMQSLVETQALERYSAGDEEGARSLLSQYTNQFAQAAVAQAVRMQGGDYTILPGIGSWEDPPDAGPEPTDGGSRDSSIPTPDGSAGEGGSRPSQGCTCMTSDGGANARFILLAALLGWVGRRRPLPR